MKEYKVVVMGSGGVGKSALTVQYVQSVFVEKYDPTIEDSYRKVIETLGKDAVALEILDTAGTEQFTAMRDMYMKNGDGFLFVYSLTSPATLHDLHTLKDRLDRVKPNAKIILVANKSDLAAERSVSRAQGESMAKKWDCPYIETSARQKSSVDDAFTLLLSELEKKRPPQTNTNGNGRNNGKTSDKNGTGKKKKKCIIV